MAIYWNAEGMDLDDDPISGARITRLTTRPVSNINILLHRILYQSEEALSHLQVNPVHGRDLLVQVNRGQRFDPKSGHWIRDHITVTHIFIDTETGAERSLPVGPPHTANSCGHAAWIGDTGRIGLAVNWTGMVYRKDAIAHGNLHDPRHPGGNFITAGPDDAAPTVFQAPEHLFNHVNVSKCGRYFVCDSYRHGLPGPIELVVGDLQSGRHATLVADCGAEGGGAAVGHPHAYFTADNTRVIYNSNRTGICHVYATRLPDDFLARLRSGQTHLI